MLSILVSCELEETYVATEIGEHVVSLGISEADFEFWDTGKTPSRPVFGRELGRDPKLENLGLTFELVIIFAVVDGRKARDVHLPAIIVLTDVLGQKGTSLDDVENLVGGLNLDSLLVP